MSQLLPRLSADHRERLLEAMADAVREDGLERVTVATVVSRARTSRRTFYEHFADREACFLELFDAVAGRLIDVIVGAAAEAGEPGDRIERALGAYVAALASDPELARACIRDTPVIGRRGIERMRAIDRRWAEVIVAITSEAAQADPRVREVPIEVAVVITGGFRDLTARTLDEGGDPASLEAIGADIVQRLTVAS